ncbi:hypothetical protein MYX82_12400, partial [Acidobacteria bacterium AH-259-D05]|nr:hypothetical protein [Acidobacteria bacterium AH-259-D05]
MKIEARHNNQTYLIHLVERKNLELGSHFEIKIQGPDGEQVLKVRVLSRSQERWTLEVNGKIQDVLISETQDHLLIDWANRSFPIQVYTLVEKLLRKSVRGEREGPASVTAQMPGKVMAVLANQGQRVQLGQGLVIVEAMKMQN